MDSYSNVGVHFMRIAVDQIERFWHYYSNDLGLGTAIIIIIITINLENRNFLDVIIYYYISTKHGVKVGRVVCVCEREFARFCMSKRI